MQNKYKVSKLNDLDNWDNFELSSPQSSIFSCKQAILTYKKNLDLYSITKGQEIKSIIYLFKENKKIVGTPLIYSGILFQPQNKQKNCRYLAEKFKLNEIFINEILSSYKNINFNLHFNVEDIRPDNGDGAIIKLGEILTLHPVTSKIIKDIEFLKCRKPLVLVKLIGEILQFTNVYYYYSS